MSRQMEEHLEAMARTNQQHMMLIEKDSQENNAL